VPELAEVEHSRRSWDVGLGHQVEEVILRRPEIRIFRGTDAGTMARELLHQPFVASAAKGKQMAFQFGAAGDRWVGIHLGMAGRLRVASLPFVPAKHDYLALRLNGRWLVFSDTRFFGRVQFHAGSACPPWWRRLPPSILDRKFTAAEVSRFLARRKKTPLKAVLLMQERFPGIGNWMADEILWRARLHPKRLAGELDASGAYSLWRTTRLVCRRAVNVVNDDWEYPDTWLFAHRWEKGGDCPRCGTALHRAEVGGRTTCWCPQCQPADGAGSAKGGPLDPTDGGPGGT
jgi:formamidopyrimidine-DNA glycosylase